MTIIAIHHDIGSYNQFARTCFVTLIACGLFFLFYPTSYPRPDYPITDNFLVNLVMSAIQAADTPNNCFPSLHVALSAVGAISLRNFSPKVRVLFWTWALLIFVSTLTTKQHYVLDVVAGISVALFVAFLDRLYERYLLERVTKVFSFSKSVQHIHSSHQTTRHLK